ncbi:MAG: FAD-binding protein, partial [Pseudomonadota bacterium]|nr:FAD-binding protein [Pseudomonadota bacterium]
MTIETEWRDYDVVVVGSGGAGSIAARVAADEGARVLVVSKDPIGCSDTKISEGNATVRAVAVDDDTEETLSENVRMAGGNLPVKEITNAFAKDSQSAFDLFRTQGLRPAIDHERDGPKATPMAFGGHNKRRSVGLPNHGIAFGHANWNAVVQGNGVDYLEDAWFLDLVTGETKDDKTRIVGGLIYDASGGKLIAVRAPAVIIAAGGLSTLFFPKTDTMRGNTGDSYAVAARAGAELVDMEQVQFLPF